jgi:5-methylcytosine-specific restriction endonuclease McrA
MAVESGLAIKWRATHANKNRALGIRRIRPDRIYKHAACELRRIRARCDKIESALSSDLLDAYRAKYKAEQKAFRAANAQAIARDAWRRANNRRRNQDPTCNRGTERNWWTFDVYKEFGYVCAYCGMTREAAKLEGFDLQADHIIPLGAPGCVSGPDNTAPACIHCNASKGKRDLLEWSTAKVITPHPLALSKYHALKESHGIRQPLLQA